MYVAKLNDVVGDELEKIILEGLDTLTNNQKIELYSDLSDRSNMYFKERKWAERNALCEPIRKLHSLIDWGFSVGDKVVDCTAKRVSEAEIKEYYEDKNTFLIKKATGGEVIVQGCMLKPYTVPQEPNEDEQVATINHMDLVEQLSFTF